MSKLLPKRTEARFVLAIVAVIVGLNVIAIGVDALVPSPEGPRSSSFATSPEGIAAWAELARRSGRDVRVLRERPSDASLPSDGTVVLLDPEDFTRGQALALRRFAERGGRVVAGGLDPGAWLSGLGAPPAWDNGASEDARVVVPSRATGAAAAIRTAGEGHWRTGRDALPLVAGSDGAVVLLRRIGKGEIALVADPSPLQNRLLDKADNATLALALAGDGPLVFVEGPHGYGTTTGLAALPARFKWALGLLALSALRADRRALAAARPARAARRSAVPAAARVRRRAGGDARPHARPHRGVRGRTLGRARATRPPRGPAARRERRDLTAAARAAGLSDEEASALQDITDDDGIAAGRALARLSRR